MQDENVSLSEREIDAKIEDALGTLTDMLDEMTETPHTRELRAKARSYERLVKGWATTPPSTAQRGATFDLVSDLHLKVVAARHPGEGRRGQRP
jgi:hypothetical protein